MVLKLYLEYIYYYYYFYYIYFVLLCFVYLLICVCVYGLQVFKKEISELRILTLTSQGHHAGDKKWFLDSKLFSLKYPF